MEVICEKTNTQPDCSDSQLLCGHEGSFLVSVSTDVYDYVS